MYIMMNIKKARVHIKIEKRSSKTRAIQIATTRKAREEAKRHFKKIFKCSCMKQL